MLGSPLKRPPVCVCFLLATVIKELNEWKNATRQKMMYEAEGEKKKFSWVGKKENKTKDRSEVKKISLIRQINSHTIHHTSSKTIKPFTIEIIAVRIYLL